MVTLARLTVSASENNAANANANLNMMQVPLPPVSEETLAGIRRLETMRAWPFGGAVCASHG